MCEWVAGRLVPLRNSRPDWKPKTWKTFERAEWSGRSRANFRKFVSVAKTPEVFRNFFFLLLSGFRVWWLSRKLDWERKVSMEEDVFDMNVDMLCISEPLAFVCVTWCAWRRRRKQRGEETTSSDYECKSHSIILPPCFFFRILNFWISKRRERRKRVRCGVRDTFQRVCNIISARRKTCSEMKRKYQLFVL